MAKDHADLQKKTKKIYERYGWYVTENKKGMSNRRYNSGIKGIADLQAIKPGCDILWLEIKTPRDIQKPDQIIFQKEVEILGHKYYLIYSVIDIYKILEKHK